MLRPADAQLVVQLSSLTVSTQTWYSVAPAAALQVKVTVPGSPVMPLDGDSLLKSAGGAAPTAKLHQLS